MTPLPVKTSNQAEVDIAHAAEIISRDSIEAAIRFVDAVEALCEALSKQPLLGSIYPHPRFADLRCSRVDRFQDHLLFYQVQADHLFVVRVIHGRRDLPTALSDG